MQIVFLVVSPIFTILFGILLTASLKPVLPRPAKLVCVFVVSFANIVLVAEILGSIYELSSWGFWLVFQAVLLALSAFVWRRRGTPQFSFHRTLPPLASISASIRQYPILWIFGAIVCTSYVVGAWLILYVPPNNYDGMSYHLARVGYWLQFQSFFPWETANIRQIIFPPNAEIAALWTILLRGTDQLAGFVQWISALVSAIAIFGIGRVLGFMRAQSIFPALIYLILSEIYLQSTTVQNDLVVSAFFVAALYLLLLGLQTRHYGALLISGVAVGLCVGTKSTAAFALFGLACAALVLWLRDARKLFRLFIVWGSACLFSVLVWGIYIYALNIMAFGNPLGSSEFLELTNSSTFVSGTYFGLEKPIYKKTYSRFELLAINMPRYLTSMLDFSSLGTVGQELTRAKFDVFDRIFTNTSTALAWTSGNWDWETSKSIWWGPNEDTSWFGPLGFFVFLPGIGYGLYRGIMRRDRMFLFLAIIPIIFFVTHSMSQSYTPAKGRYYVLVVTAAAPLMIWPVVSSKFVWRLTAPLIVCVALVTTVFNVATNGYKPLVGTMSVIDENRAQMRGGDPERAALVAVLETLIPQDAKVTVISGGDRWEYPLFGENFTRYVVPLKIADNTQLSLEDVSYQNPNFYLGSQENNSPSEPSDYIFVRGSWMQNHPRNTSGFELVAKWYDIYLFRSLDAVYDTEASSIRFEFDGTTPGYGWHPPMTTDEDITYQWTAQREATLGSIYLAPADVYRVQLHLLAGINEEVVNSLHLLANGTVIQLGRSPDNVFGAFIPKNILEREGGLLQLDLQTDRITSPYLEGLYDDRRLFGVALDWLTAEGIAAPTTTRVEFDGQYSTDGFYPSELFMPATGGESVSLQWTSKATSVISFPLKVNDDLLIQFRVVSQFTPNSIEHLTLSVDGHPVNLTHDSTEQETLFTGFIPRFENAANIVTLTFNTLDPVSPSLLDSTYADMRTLGIALDWLTIKPLKSVTSARIEFDGRDPMHGWNPSEGNDPDF